MMLGTGRRDRGELAPTEPMSRHPEWVTVMLCACSLCWPAACAFELADVVEPGTGGAAGHGDAGSGGGHGGFGASGGGQGGGVAGSAAQAGAGGFGAPAGNGGVAGSGGSGCQPLYTAVHDTCQCSQAGGTVLSQESALVCRFASACPGGWTKFRGEYQGITCTQAPISPTDGCNYGFPGSSCTSPTGWYMLPPTCSYVTVSTDTDSPECIGDTAWPDISSCANAALGGQCDACTCDLGGQEAITWTMTGDPCLERPPGSGEFHRVCVYSRLHVVSVNDPTICTSTATGQETCY